MSACILGPIHFLQEVTEVRVDKAEMQSQSPCVSLIELGRHVSDSSEGTESEILAGLVCCSQSQSPFHMHLDDEETTDWENTDTNVQNIEKGLTSFNGIEINRIIISNFEGLSSVACEKGIIFDDG